MQQPSFYFFDYETFGTQPAQDRPAQFAGVRTDSDFNPINTPLVIYCTPCTARLPSPQSCLITGITPRIAAEKGLPESTFITQILTELKKPNTCLLGYNNIRFDDEVTRYTLYRNLHDPYAHEWEHGNSRWDLLDVVRAFYALRPEGLKWPVDEQSQPTFKLEALCKENGIEHASAHDALSDVTALIGLTKKLKSAQPRLFDYLWNNRTKKQIRALLDQAQDRMLLHVSGMFGTQQGCMSWIYPIAPHPSQPNAVIAVDLSQDCTALINQDAQSIKKNLFTAKSERDFPVPLKCVHINKCPVLAPANALSSERAQRFGLDQELCRQRFTALQSTPNLSEKLQTVYQLASDDTAFDNSDPEQALYSGFISRRDKHTLAHLHTLSPEDLVTAQPRFDDERLPTLFERFKARNYFELLSESEQKNWQNYCQDKIMQQLPDFVEQIEQQLSESGQNPEKVALLKDLYHYYQS